MVWGWSMARRRRRRPADSYGHARSDGLRSGPRRGGRGFLSARPRRPRLFGDPSRIQRAQLADGRVVEMRAGDLFELRQRVGFEAVKVLRGPRKATSKAKDLRPMTVRKRGGAVEFVPYMGRLNPTGRPVAPIPQEVRDGETTA